MIQLIIIIIVAVLFSAALKEKIHTVFPDIVMAAMLVMYCFSLFIRDLKLCVIISLAVLLFSSVVFCLIKKDISVKHLKESVFTPQFVIFFLTCAFFVFLFSNKKVFHWDDLSYWGIFAKDLLYLNKLPLGVENCTIDYKDYTPIMQLAQFFFLCFRKEYSESGLFQVNICFLYLLMLPFLNHIEKKSTINKITSVFLFVFLPHVFSTQFYYKLGIDFIISVVFGYGLYRIAENYFEKSGLRLFSVTITASFLVLVKNSGIILTLFLILFYALCTNNTDESQGLLKRSKVVLNNAVWCGAMPLLFYFSWDAWERLSSNRGYLADIVSADPGSLYRILPTYTGSVILHYIKYFFIYPLTRDTYGITAFLMTVCIIASYVIKGKILAGDGDGLHRSFYYLIMGGMIIFCLGHIYMYLFFFNEWEAEELLEFDRYITQYLAGAFYYYMYSLSDASEVYCRRHHKNISPIVAFCILFIILMPYSSINTYLVPSHYDNYYEKEWKPLRDNAVNELEASGIKDLRLPYDEANRIMLIANGWSDELQFLLYELVPQPVAVVGNIPAVEEGNLSNYINSLSNGYNIKYVYVCGNISQDYAGDFSEESRMLTVDGNPLKEGNLYVRDDKSDGVRYALLDSGLTQ